MYKTAKQYFLERKITKGREKSTGILYKQKKQKTGIRKIRISGLSENKYNSEKVNEIRNQTKVTWGITCDTLYCILYIFYISYSFFNQMIVFL